MNEGGEMMRMRNFTLMAIVLLAISAGPAMAQLVIAPQISVTLTRYDPYPAQPGSYVTVWINIENRGAVDAPNVTLEFLSEYPFSLDPGTSAMASVGKISASDTALLQYKIRVDQNAVTGTNKLKFRYQSNADNTWTIGNLDVYVLGKNKIDVGDVSTTLLEPGKSTPVVFTLDNVGSSAITDISFSWTQPSSLILPVGSDNKKYISSIGAGEKEIVTFVMTTNPDTTPGVYPVTITIGYNDGNTTATSTSDIGFIVGGTTDFDISAESSGSQVTLSIANIGTNNADSVTVEIPQQPSFSATGASSSILGNLNKGDYTTATFQVVSRVARNSTGSGFGSSGIGQQQNLLVRIYYTDTTGERQTVDKEVPVSPAASSSSASSGFAGQRSQSSSQGLMYIIIGVAGIASVVGFFLYRRRKKKKK